MPLVKGFADDAIGDGTQQDILKVGVVDDVAAVMTTTVTVAVAARVVVHAELTAPFSVLQSVRTTVVLPVVAVHVRVATAVRAAVRATVRAAIYAAVRTSVRTSVGTKVVAVVAFGNSVAVTVCGTMGLGGDRQRADHDHGGECGNQFVHGVTPLF